MYWEEADYYDSDDDTFLDRTGSIERKREQRMRKAGKKKAVVETYETLTNKMEDIVKEMSEIDMKLEQAKRDMAEITSEEDDALEAYMSAIK